MAKRRFKADDRVRQKPREELRFRQLGSICKLIVPALHPFDHALLAQYADRIVFQSGFMKLRCLCDAAGLSYYIFCDFCRCHFDSNFQYTKSNICDLLIVYPIKWTFARNIIFGTYKTWKYEKRHGCFPAIEWKYKFWYTSRARIEASQKSEVR